MSGSSLSLLESGGGSGWAHGKLTATPGCGGLEAGVGLTYSYTHCPPLSPLLSEIWGELECVRLAFNCSLRTFERRGLKPERVGMAGTARLFPFRFSRFSSALSDSGWGLSPWAHEAQLPARFQAPRRSG